MSTDDTKTAEEKDFILKIELGVVLPMRVKMNGDEPDNDDMQIKAHDLAEALVAHMRQSDVPPQIITLLGGEAMSVDTFEQLKENARHQAAALAQVLQTLAGNLPEGMEVSVNGHTITSEASDQAEAVDAVVPGEDAEPVEAGDDVFRIPGTRTLQ